MANQPIHIIGVGAVGSTLAELLTRIGFEGLHLYDFDTVDAHNVTNQMFREIDIGSSKLNAIAGILTEINPAAAPQLHPKGWNPGDRLDGYVFLCPDNIDLRRQVAEENRTNPNVVAMFDFRMRLTDAQHYAADWSSDRQVQNFLGTMQFSHEEAQEATPVNACGSTLSVAPTVRTLCSLGVANFMNFVKEGALKNMVLLDPFAFEVSAF